ncbi:hypothetical protein EHR10_06125 [Leptospira yasudae]|nr:hypothetical protein EHR10_06125 [Leptospira yasudae]
MLDSWNQSPRREVKRIKSEKNLEICFPFADPMKKLKLPLNEKPSEKSENYLDSLTVERR